MLMNDANRFEFGESNRLDLIEGEERARMLALESREERRSRENASVNTGMDFEGDALINIVVEEEIEQLEMMDIDAEDVVFADV
jgi:hypothetical protein